MSEKNRDEVFVPTVIEVRGAKVNNLKNIDVDVPLNQLVGICGVSGSGKSSLATDVLYAEGSRRYLEALSTYTRRRIGQTARPNVESIRFLPSALALRQRPGVPNIRSTVGTMSEVLNVLRLMFSRLGSHVCPNGHRLSPSLAVAQTGQLTCPVCGIIFNPPGAESFAFNSAGACPTCHGTGEVRSIDPVTLIKDENLTIQEGAVAAWRIPGAFFYPKTAEKLGVPLDVPYKKLSKKNKELILHGQLTKVPVDITDKSGKTFHMEATFLNAYDAIDNAYQKTSSEKSLKRLNKFYHIGRCPTCHGSRFAPILLKSLLMDKNIAVVSAMSLNELLKYANKIMDKLPKEMHDLATKLTGELVNRINPLLLLGLDYLSLDRAGNTLSTGELQRLQLARTLRNETTGVLYVLDEPSIGLHPANVAGLLQVLQDLLAQGNSLVVVDHELAILQAANYLIEIGPGAGKSGGKIVATGTVDEVSQNKNTVIGPYIDGTASLVVRDVAQSSELFQKGRLEIKIKELYTLKDVTADFPIGRLTAVTGVSGSGKTALVLDSLIPALQAVNKKQKLPQHVDSVSEQVISRVVMVDAVPVGKNIRSTVATFSGILDEVRKLFAQTQAAQEKGFTAGHFSYNNKAGVCPNCGGTGQVSLDIQFLPDMEMVCPVCHGERYNEETLAIKWQDYSINDILGLTLEDAQNVFKDDLVIERKLSSLVGLGLGYLTLGEATPTLSGGEAQRLKLVAEMGKVQQGTLFVFDEPTTGLHPKDIRTLIHVFDQLLATGATIIVIEHDLDLIANADYVIDMGPGGGDQGGQLVAAGTPKEVSEITASLTGEYLKAYVENFKQ